MSSTKIINVLRTDSFEETLKEFNESSATEVIFVLPKSPRAFKKSDHFAALAAEAQTQGKKATFLTSDPSLADLALTHGFDVLEQKKNSQSAPKKKSIPLNKKEDEHEVPVRQGVDEEIAEWFASPAKVEEKTESPMIDNEPIDNDYIEEEITEKPVIKEILTPDTETTPVRIAHQKEKQVLIDVRNEKTIFPKGRINLVPGSGQVKKWILPSLIVATILVVGGIVVATTGSAKIEITPQKKPLEFQIKVTASDSVASVNTQSNRIPGQYIEINKQVSREFKSSGQKDVAQKARGKIIIFNETGSGQPLVTTTRFASPAGLIFRTLMPVVVPANGKVSVDVIADKSGGEYNLQPSTFTIAAFKEKGDTVKTQKIYGKSEEPMRGGANGLAKVVTEDDYAGAVNAVKNDLTSVILEQLKNQSGSFKVISDSRIEYSEPQASAKADDAAETFTVSILGTLKTVGFRQSDLDELMANHVEMDNDLKYVPSQATLSYNNVAFRDTDNSLEFTVNATGYGYMIIDELALLGNLAGRHEDDIRTYLKSIQQVESARVVLSPFWVTKVPSNKAKIKTEILYQ